MGQLTQQIAGAYIGAQVYVRITHPEIEGNPEYTGTIVAVLKETILYKSGRVLGEVPYDQCKLILTPQSHITDEDAVEVAKMAIGDLDNDSYYKYVPNDKPEKYGLLDIHPDVSVVGVELFIDHPYYMHWSPMYLIQIDHDEFDITKGFYSRDAEYSDEIPDNTQHIIDYLRSRNYDLGYGSDKSGIETGWAISSVINK